MVKLPMISNCLVITGLVHTTILYTIPPGEFYMECM